MFGRGFCIASIEAPFTVSTCPALKPLQSLNHHAHVTGFSPKSRFDRGELSPLAEKAGGGRWQLARILRRLRRMAANCHRPPPDFSASGDNSPRSNRDLGEA